MRTAIFITSIILITVVTALFIRLTLAGKNTANSLSVKDNSAEHSKIANQIRILKTWDLPPILKEISAIAYIDEHRFACIQDEAGKIFIYNAQKKEIEKEIEFGNPGDYEGLALHANTAYVLRADGQIIEVNNYINSSHVTTVHKTSLTKKQNAEGLAFDKENNRLLIAIKGPEAVSDKYKGIYAFNLDNKKLIKEPVFKIDLENEVFDRIKSGKKKGSRMQPSEIAIHPKNGNIYITDGAKPKLLIMNRSGKILSLSELKNSKFSQPEGLAFTPDGRLFISNEGTDNSGNILEINVSQ